MPDNKFPARVENKAANPVLHNTSVDYWHYGHFEAHTRFIILAESVWRALPFYFEPSITMYDC